MASIKVKFRPSSVNGKKGVIYYQIIQNRVIRQLRTDYHVAIDDWDEENFIVKTDNSEQQKELVEIQENINWDVKRLEYVVSLLEKKEKEFSADDIINFYEEHLNELSLFSFMREQIKRLQKEDKQRTAETYTTTLYSIGRFLNHKDILMDEITSDLIKKYEESLHEQGVTKNSSSFYMRIVRAAYNRAVSIGVIEQHYPFKEVYTGIDQTVRHALPLSFIKRMKDMDYSNNQPLEFARDMFMFSFYTRGMAFVDMSFLKKTDLTDGSLVYRRRKNGQKLFVRWEPCMQEIVDKYAAAPENPYLLNILTPPFKNERNQYKNVLYQLNKSLKEVGTDLGLNFPLTMYVARHSWASIAHSKDVDVSVISEGLGNDSEQATQIYLASLDNTLVDKANSSILEDL